jgi:hypothetical protein
MILTHSNVFAGMVHGPALPDKNISSLYSLSAIKLHTQSFAF